MKKNTVIKHTTSTGIPVEIMIERIYGDEPVRYFCDGTPIMTTHFEDQYSIEILYEGKSYRSHIDYNDKAPGGRGLSLEPGKLLCLPPEKWEEVDKAISERLGGVLTPFECETIAEVKAAIKSGHIMPRDELIKKRKHYDDVFNEGGYGFNPYEDYVSAEHVERIKSKFPDQFND